jgi:integrase/recombinase XerD
MLEQYFSKAKTIDRIRQSWIAESIEKYVVWLEEHGHSKQTIHRRGPLLVQFGEDAKEHGAKSVEDLPNHLSEFASFWEERSRCCKKSDRRKTLTREVRGCLCQMLSIVLPGYDGHSRSRRTYAPLFDFTGDFFKFLTEERTKQSIIPCGVSGLSFSYP